MHGDTYFEKRMPSCRREHHFEHTECDIRHGYGALACMRTLIWQSTVRSCYEMVFSPAPEHLFFKTCTLVQVITPFSTYNVPTTGAPQGATLEKKYIYIYIYITYKMHIIYIYIHIYIYIYIYIYSVQRSTTLIKHRHFNVRQHMSNIDNTQALQHHKHQQLLLHHHLHY